MDQKDYVFVNKFGSKVFFVDGDSYTAAKCCAHLREIGFNMNEQFEFMRGLPVVEAGYDDQPLVHRECLSA